MKGVFTTGLAIALLATSASSMALSRSQHDTAVGALLGGAAGAVVGNDVTTTIAGAALGGVVGSQWNAHKQEVYERDDHHDGHDNGDNDRRHRFQHEKKHHELKFDHNDRRDHHPSKRFRHDDDET